MRTSGDGGVVNGARIAKVCCVEVRAGDYCSADSKALPGRGTTGVYIAVGYFAVVTRAEGGGAVEVEVDVGLVDARASLSGC